MFALEEDLWGTVPTRRHVLGVRGLALRLTRQTKIGKLDDDNYVTLGRRIRGSIWRNGAVVVQAGCRDEEVLRLHVAMKVARLVYVV